MDDKDIKQPQETKGLHLFVGPLRKQEEEDGQGSTAKQTPLHLTLPLIYLHLLPSSSSMAQC